MIRRVFFVTFLSVNCWVAGVAVGSHREVSWLTVMAIVVCAFEALRR